MYVLGLVCVCAFRTHYTQCVHVKISTRLSYGNFLHIPDEKLNYRKFHNIHNSSNLNKFLVTEFIQVRSEANIYAELRYFFFFVLSDSSVIFLVYVSVFFFAYIVRFVSFFFELFHLPISFNHNSSELWCGRAPTLERYNFYDYCSCCCVCFVFVLLSCSSAFFFVPK